MQENTYKIATILTCYNRKALTVQALQALFEAADAYNRSVSKGVDLEIFLTDDGCTDGTADAVRTTFTGKAINIIPGTGNLFWSGGMILAWNEALKTQEKWDFYLLMNDDTLLYADAFNELFATHAFALEQTGKSGLYSGVCRSMDEERITYGGMNYNTGSPLGKAVMVIPNGRPQPCLMTNANILLAASNVVKEIGIFDKEYIHCCGDWAYGIRANRAGLPVYITGKACGRCDYDHDSEKEEAAKVTAMTISERKKYFSSPLHSRRDALIFLKKYQRLKFIVLYLSHKLKIYLPALYYSFSTKRK